MLMKPSLQAGFKWEQEIASIFAQYLKFHMQIYKRKKDVKTAFSFVEQQQLWQ